MTPLIHQVARAIAGHFGPEFDKLPKDRVELRAHRRHGVGIFEVDAITSGNTQSDILDAARAALEAIREPTPGMIEAGADNLFGAAHDDWSEDAKAIWQVMIDADLAENTTNTTSYTALNNTGEGEG